MDANRVPARPGTELGEPPENVVDIAEITSRPANVAEWLDSVGGLFSERRSVGGVPVVVSSPALAVRQVVSLAMSNLTASRHVHFVNAYTVALASKDPDLMDVLHGDAVNFPDGKPLSWLSRLFGDEPSLDQVRGPEFFEAAMDLGRRDGLRHFLLGSTPEVLERLQARLAAKYPGVQIVGAHSPAFREPTDEELAQQDAMIAASGAHVVWVGLGTPKQDYEARRIAARLSILTLSVGAAFDFSAGTLQRAPAWVTAIGMEWFFRLIREPRRLWRRYLFGNTRFLIVAVRAHRGERRATALTPQHS